MQTGHTILKNVIALISAAIGGLFGAIGGPAGVIAGIISGWFVGYYYVHFTLTLANRNKLSRIFLGTLYGTLAGLISGVSVHIPNILIKAGGDNSIAGLGIGAVFGIVIGTVFGFIIACVIAFIPTGKESLETSSAMPPVQEAPQDITLSPKEAELILTTYPALKEHNLFDKDTARDYRAKFNLSGSPAELEGKYAQALTWLQAKRPDFTLEQWEAANASIHQLVRFMITKGARGEAGLEKCCPGLGEEFYGWIAKAARLFA